MLFLKVAGSSEELKKAQRLRYEIFFNHHQSEKEVVENDEHSGLDVDRYDAFCKHLLVLDTEQEGVVVATTRVLLGSWLPDGEHYIAEDEFEIPFLKESAQEARKVSMEVGRSCVHPEYRDGGAIQLLWQGIAKFALDNDVRVIFGCASFHGVDVDEHLNEISYLMANYPAPNKYQSRSLANENIVYKAINEIDENIAVQRIPTLIKAYTKLGGVVGPQIYVDRVVNTIDILVIVDVDLIPRKFLNFFSKIKIISD
ncbi:GNAT family N-acyltransferase [Oceanospirillum sp. HFRX-1_2]